MVCGFCKITANVRVFGEEADKQDHIPDVSKMVTSTKLFINQAKYHNCYNALLYDGFLTPKNMNLFKRLVIALEKIADKKDAEFIVSDIKDLLIQNVKLQ